jgi:23S rRNA pseudouridine2605 synthase
MLERLQKIIARAGVASRRRAEQLILSGQVTLNGRVILELGTKADPERDHIKVAGKLVRPAENKIYLMLHKPDGVVATLSDPEGRRSLANLLHGVPARVYPVGRLEYHASGLLLLTNDGELANLVMRAHGLPQTYWLKVKGSLNPSEFSMVEARTGVKLRRLKGGANPWYEATVTASSNDRLRQTLLQMAHPVEKLRRVKLSHLELASLPAGKFRPLTEDEVRRLKRACLHAGLPARRTPRGVHHTDPGHSKRNSKNREYRAQE